MTFARAAARRLWLVLAIGLVAAGAVATAASGGATRRPRAATKPTAMATPASIGSAPAGARLDLTLPLVADDAGLARFATAVSTPTSPLYGHFESVQALTRRFGAKPGAAAAVQRFLRRAGARDVSFDEVGQFVSATMTVAAAQRTFGTHLARFRDDQGQEYIAPAGLAQGAPGAHAASAQPALPAALRGRITGVVGLDTQSLATPNMHAGLTGKVGTAASAARLARGGARAAANQPTSAYLPRTGSASGCRAARGTGSFTPNQYLTAYGYKALHQSNLLGQGERAALIEIDGFRKSDIDTFARCFRLPAPHLSVMPVGGLRHPLSPGGEATLDTELMTAAAPKLSRIYIYESTGRPGHVLKAYSSALARGRRPQVISASLGICEPLALGAMGPAGINGIERILRTAAGAGVSVLASAGDQGSSSCVYLGRIQHRLAVSYPASSPWVTGVGGTNMVVGRSNHLRAELVWNDTYAAPDAGGGGFSGLFARPAFQSAFQTTGRVVPDVSMLADLAPGYAIYCTVRGADCGKGGWTGAGGTSAAAPLLAAGVTLIDQDLRNHHHHGLGDLNPLLYLLGSGPARTQVFNDVTAINNDLGPYLPGTNHQQLGCCAAGLGYDAASGWGSVNLATLAHIVAPPKKG